MCGNYTLQELSPSEGYLLNDEIYTLGTEPENYVIEMNPVSLDVTENVKKGCISIIKHSETMKMSLKILKRALNLRFSSSPQAVTKMPRIPKKTVS